jgi:hypothetical protein
MTTTDFRAVIAADPDLHSRGLRLESTRARQHKTLAVAPRRIAYAPATARDLELFAKMHLQLSPRRERRRALRVQLRDLRSRIRLAFKTGRQDLATTDDLKLAIERAELVGRVARHRAQGGSLRP